MMDVHRPFRKRDDMLRPFSGVISAATSRSRQNTHLALMRPRYEHLSVGVRKISRPGTRHGQQKVITCQVAAC
jgi:hypothetical protein